MQHKEQSSMMKDLKIIMITGSYPPMRCGVGDYTYQLSKEIGNRQIDISILSSRGARLDALNTVLHPVVKKWSLLRMICLADEIRRASPHIVHMQYPTIGYGYRLGPQALLVLLRLAGIKVVTTVHEFRLASIPRRISIVPFILWSNALIVTSDEERAAITNACPRLKNKLQKWAYVIPVGSNIPVIHTSAPSENRDRIVSFFGLFYPGRKIELVINSFRKVSEAHPDLKFRFIGDVHPRYKGYFEKIKQLSEAELPPEQIEWVLGKSPEEIAVALKGSRACILPFPDGASFRRSTLIAVLSLGVPTITTKGASTPSQLIDGLNVLFAADKDAIAEKIDNVLTNKALSTRLSENAMILSSSFSWDHITAEHIKVYDKLYNKDNEKAERGGC